MSKGFTGKIPWNKGLTKATDKRLAESGQKISASLKKNPKVGCCTPEYIGSKAHRLASSKGGGYKENAGRTQKYHIQDSFGNDVCLQSTYELETSKLLNEYKIKWKRPLPLRYDNNRLYYPDFYLPEYDVYLDPKNDYLIKTDLEKIHKVCEQNNVIVKILSKKEINPSLVQWLERSPDKRKKLDRNHQEGPSCTSGGR